MPRNEFKAGDGMYICPFCKREIQDGLDKLIEHRESGECDRYMLERLGAQDHPGKGDDEDLSQEVPPVEEDPSSEVPLNAADLRKSHRSITEAHRRTAKSPREGD